MEVVAIVIIMIKGLVLNIGNALGQGNLGLAVVEGILADGLDGIDVEFFGHNNLATFVLVGPIVERKAVGFARIVLDSKDANVLVRLVRNLEHHLHGVAGAVLLDAGDITSNDITGRGTNLVYCEQRYERKE